MVTVAIVVLSRKSSYLFAVAAFLSYAPITSSLCQLQGFRLWVWHLWKFNTLKYFTIGHLKKKGENHFKPISDQFSVYYVSKFLFFLFLLGPLSWEAFMELVAWSKSHFPKIVDFSFWQELEDPLILIHEKKISSINAVVKVLELALKVNNYLSVLIGFTLFSGILLSLLCSMYC